MNKIRNLILASALTLGAALPSHAGVYISVRIAPPPLPVYEQPVVPAAGYIWTPGYWAWDDDEEDYYWVPGTWALAPAPGYLWTPGYWGWSDGFYLWHPGYWGVHIGYYGGINYGFGYYGYGYDGGRWIDGRFHYNTAVNNINVTYIHNTYNTRIIQRDISHVSYNGGRGGIVAAPRDVDRAAERDRHIEYTEHQREHQRDARSNRDQFMSANHGRPDIAATGKAGDFDRHNVTHVRDVEGPNGDAPRTPVVPNLGRQSPGDGGSPHAGDFPGANRPDRTTPPDQGDRRFDGRTRDPRFQPQTPEQIHPPRPPEGDERGRRFDEAGSSPRSRQPESANQPDTPRNADVPRDERRFDRGIDPRFDRPERQTNESNRQRDDRGFRQPSASPAAPQPPADNGPRRQPEFRQPAPQEPRGLPPGYGGGVRDQGQRNEGQRPVEPRGEPQQERGGQGHGRPREQIP